MKKLATVFFSLIVAYCSLVVILEVVLSCVASEEPAPDTGRLHANFDAYGYQLDHDVYDGLVER